MNNEDAEKSIAAMSDMQVPIPPRLDGDQLSAYVIEAQRIADETMLQDEQADACLGMPELDGGDVLLFQRVKKAQPGGFSRRRAVHVEAMACRSMAVEPMAASARHAPPDLHAAVLSFPARLLTYVNEKCGGAAPMAYKRAGVSRQIYSRIISRDDSTVDKRTAMLFCVGLQLEMNEAELLMKSAGYAFSGTLPEDRVFSYCIEKKIWNLLDINDILVECGLRPLTAEKDPYR